MLLCFVLLTSSSYTSTVIKVLCKHVDKQQKLKCTRLTPIVQNTDRLKAEGSLMKFTGWSAVGVHPSSWKHPSPAVHSACGGRSVELPLRVSPLTLVCICGKSRQTLLSRYGYKIHEICISTMICFKTQRATCQRKGCSKPQACFIKYLLWPRV